MFGLFGNKISKADFLSDPNVSRQYPTSLIPQTCEAVWSRLGDALRDCEFPTMQRIPGERVITLRLDGSGSLAKTMGLKKPLKIEEL